MKTSNWFLRTTAVIVTAFVAQHAPAAVTAEEAEQLKTTLTPVGAERAGNKEGTIPAWTGGLTTPTPGFKNGERRPDPFAAEKPLFSVTAKNIDQHGSFVAEGVKEMLRKYPDSYRLDVYPTHRTAAMPQWVYDNTFKNATRAKLISTGGKPGVQDAYGGVPFPIPKVGEEVMINHMLKYRSPSDVHKTFNSYLMSADAKWIKVVAGVNEETYPYYRREGPSSAAGDSFFMVRSINTGPPIRAGEAIVARQNVDNDNDATWVYLTGQRRVRKLPAPCCDTPTPFSAGVVSYDEVEVWSGRLDRFDWKLVGKKELFIPYNSNRTNVPSSDAALLGPGHLNPDHVRWELHRVWVVEATLRAGQRHPVAKSRYYVDEDTWSGVLAERWDSKGQLWRVAFTLPIAMPDVPATAAVTWGVYDLIGGTSFIATLMNEQSEQLAIPAKPYAPVIFTPDSLAESLR